MNQRIDAVPDLALYRVLLADDDPEIRAAYRQCLAPDIPTLLHEDLKTLETDLFGAAARPPAALQASQFDLTFRATSEDAITAVENALAMQMPYDAVVLDKRMPPGIDGIEAAQHIRRLDNNAMIVLVTGDHNDETLIRLRRFAEDTRFFIFFKPFQAAELRQFLRAICDNARMAADLAQLNHSLEEKVRARTTELEEARDRAEAASRTKSKFLANMSHELRTPLNGILGMAQLLKLQEKDAEQAKRIQTISTAGECLLDLIEDLLDLSAIEARKLEIKQEPLTVDALINRAIAATSGLALRKRLRVTVQIAPGLDAPFLGDQQRLSQVLINLIGNAVKFSDFGEIIVSAAPVGPDTVRFAVRDQGAGIPEENLRAIFERFRQGHAASEAPIQGTGLGLAICRELVELMDGEIGVESIYRVGSEFWFQVPVDWCEYKLISASEVP
ncbi:MAG: ATP-binding protein [Pseudomonadota bacterium]